MGICTGSQIVSTHFAVPGNVALGKSTIQVITNGIASTPIPLITVYPEVSASAVSVVEGTANGTGSVQNVWAVDGLDYTVKSVSGTANGYSGQEAAIEADFYFPSGNTFSTMAVQTSAAAVTGATGMLYAYNWSTGAFDYLGNATMSSAQTAFSFSVTSPASRYFSRSGEVRVIVRAVVPSRLSNQQFQLSTDLVQVAAN